MTLPPVPSFADLPGPTSILSPSIALFGEDLDRFPSTSLHSFSFSGPSEDFVHSRNNALKRSIEVFKDRSNWAAGGLGIASAQAKLSGDQDVQKTVALLDKANLLDTAEEFAGAARRSAFIVGPVTGPATISSRNPFEESFMVQRRTESPTSMLDSPGATRSSAAEDDLHANGAATPTQSTFDLKIESPKDANESSLRVDTEMAQGPSKTPPRSRRTSLKRTFTDTEPLYLKDRLDEALSQPFLSGGDSMISPTLAQTPSFPTPLFPQVAPHSAHGRGAPISQAIFTTQADEPWTVSAANDMACLIFGVTKAELRKIGILELIAEDKREWIAQRLRAHRSSRSQPASPAPLLPSLTTPSRKGLASTAQGKPPSREASRRSTSDDGPSAKPVGSPLEKSRSEPETKSDANPSGVLLCGDVVSIVKRNGDTGSASMWVQEKRSGLIWAVEEIAEDIAMLTVDEIGSVTRVKGASEGVWGMERVRRGMDITRLLPTIPRAKGTNTGALDFDEIGRLRRFTARTANDISVPVTVDLTSGDLSEPTFRVSSFPHIAGMLVLSASTLKVKSCNAPVSEALFGISANDLPITDIIPGFDKMLSLIKGFEEMHAHDGQMMEGMVIPGQSFRRARARMAHDEGQSDLAANFLRPAGVAARHRDGAEIMIDVEMRVVKSNVLGQSGRRPTIDATLHMTESQSSEVVYALWVTYSRTVHAANHGVGPLSPLISRPGTPPHQPHPSSQDPTRDLPDAVERSQGKPVQLDRIPEAPSDDLKMPSATLDARMMPPPPRPSEAKAVASVDGAPTASPMVVDHKKTIADFQILEEMGAGAYGQVRLARSIHYPNRTAVVKYVVKKRILVDTWTRDRRLGTVPLEIHVLDYLRRLGDDEGARHPNIVEMSDFFEDETNYYIEMVPHGIPGMDLFDLIELRTNMDEDECRRIFTQVASAVEFLHNHAKVVHRDIKDENIILDGQGVVKLIDFGSASYLKNGPFDVFVGTIDYAAPEVLAGDSYDGPEQDVWALGILLYTILYKENPFYSIDEIMDHDLRVPYLISEASIDLVRRMLNRQVDKRPSILEIVKHEWCQGGRELEGNKDWRKGSGIAIVESERKV